MGFSFAGIRKELASEKFKRFFRQLRDVCPALHPFPDVNSLIAFFHDETQDLDTKDSILFHFLTLYRQGAPYRLLAPFFIVLFTPALASIYSHGKRKCPGIDRNDLIQDICLHLIRTINEIKLSPFKVAGRIVGEVRNRTRATLNRRIREGFFESSIDDGTAFEEYPAAAADKDPIGEEKEMPDVMAILEHLVDSGQITEEDGKLITDTLIDGKALKNIAHAPAEYERLKKRRQRALKILREHLANYLKFYGE